MLLATALSGGDTPNQCKLYAMNITELKARLASITTRATELMLKGKLSPEERDELRELKAEYQMIHEEIKVKRIKKQ